MKLTRTIYGDDEGEEYEMEFPFKWGVCPTCDGRGQHVNPSIDCNGLTAEDFAEDPDFREQYFGGSYDEQCCQCDGRTTVPVIDDKNLNDEQKKAMKDWEAHLQCMAEIDAEEAAERRMGA